MTWNWDEIRREWLRDGGLADDPDVIVEAFNRVEWYLGREWIEQSREWGGAVVSGTAPTLNVVIQRKLLGALDGIQGTDKLVGKLRSGGQHAWAELTAIYLLRSNPGISVELEPSVVVGDRNRAPDFRARHHEGDWVYVEVTQPDTSETADRIQGLLDELTGTIATVRESFALEVFLLREPSGPEVEYMIDRIPHFCRLSGQHTEDLPESLGTLYLNETQPGQIVLGERKGDPGGPRLGAARAIVGADEPHRHIAVRMPYSDDRADAFLRREARQLPKDAPGLIMIQMSGTSAGIKEWEPLLQRRLQPTQHTRVGGICLWFSGLTPSERGETWFLTTNLITNTTAALPLPEWIRESLAEYAPQPEGPTQSSQP